jgi:hypothetical protein
MVKASVKECRRAYGPSALNFSLIHEKAIKLAIQDQEDVSLNLDPSVKRTQFFHIPRTQHSLSKTDLFPSVKEPVTQVFLMSML